MTTNLISCAYSGLSLIDEITPYFSPVKIYIPWGGVVPEHVDERKIIALYPPEELKPEADMDILLKECFNWANEQGETSRREIIKTGRINPTSVESLRHIKSVLNSRISSDKSEKDKIIKWHMLLHLANRLEEDRKEANRMLDELKKKPSPLLNNADLTEKTKYPLESLTGIDTDFLLNDRNIKQLLMAWHGLFNRYIKEGELLLTFDRHIFDHIWQEWDNLSSENLKTPEFTFKIPLEKALGKNGPGAPYRISLGDDLGKIVTSDNKYEEKITKLTALVQTYKSTYSPETRDEFVLISLLYFKPLEKPEIFILDPFNKVLSGNALILAEVNA